MGLAAISILAFFLLVDFENLLYDTKSPFDKFKILKIYPTKNGNEWYVNMEDPENDPLVKNFSDFNLVKQKDGSWQVSGDQVRFNVWSKPNGKWRDVEITGYIKLYGEGSWVEVYSRGGMHTDSRNCEGSSYKGKFLEDGSIEWVKEVNHPAYTERMENMTIPVEPRNSNWFGMKVIMYNFVEDGQEFVRMEMYEDKNVTSYDGDLLINNNWELISVIEDRGGWSSIKDPDFDESCPPLSYDNPGPNRLPDEILSMPGGNVTHNAVSWRSDSQIWDFKFLSVREIVSFNEK